MGDAADAASQDFEDVVLNGRMCIVSRTSLPANSLIRFVAGPDGQAVPDLKRRLPGRGAHVEATRAAVALAARRGLLRRALKTEIRGADALPDMVDGLLARSALGSLGLARKAGQLLTGAAKVEAALRGNRAAALLAASDAAPDGVRKMEQARRAAAGGRMESAAPIFRLFSSAELDLAIGGGNVVHAAVLSGDAGSALLKRLRALSVYRGDDPEASAGAAEAAGPVQSHESNGTDTAVGLGHIPAQEAEA